MPKTHHQYNIKLEEAMIVDFPQSTLVWDVIGPHVTTENIPENANVKKTFVMKSRTGKIRLGIEFAYEGELGTNMNIIVEVSALEELKDKFPKLFELEGNLHVYP